MERLGRYEIIKELGHGSMGVVYAAHDPEIDRRVAVKTIDLQRLPPERRDEYAIRLRQEAKAAGQLNHPNIVTIHDVGRSGDTAYIVMEQVQGRELRQLISGDVRLPLDQAIDIAIQAAEALACAGRHGIVHRDIKPSNVMLLEDGRIKVVDFGVARMQSVSMAELDGGGAAGSPSHMSPEQVMNLPVDARSDIFSLGVVLYQLLTGVHPFAGDNVHAVMYQIVNEAAARPSAICAEVPDMLDFIVARCLAKDPASRYQDAGELAAELRACRAKLAQAEDALQRIRAMRKNAGKNIHQLIYVSRPTSEMHMRELVEILTRAQYKNLRLDISGLLIFHNGRFMQLLEGRQQAVHDLFETIHRDARHTDVEVLWENDCAERSMPSWVMGFSAEAQGGEEIGTHNFYIPPDAVQDICEIMEGEAGRRFLEFIRGDETVLSGK